MTPVVLGAVVWAVLVQVAAALAVVVRPGGSRRASTLATVAIAVLALAYVVDAVVSPPSSM